MSRSPVPQNTHPWKKPILRDIHEGQFQYLGRWVNKEHFRAFVYNIKGEETLADSYEKFMDLTTSGLWFASRPIVKVTVEDMEKTISDIPNINSNSKQARKPKDDTIRPAS